MSQEIVRQFENDQFGKLRIIKDDDGAFWFSALDIAHALGARDADRIVRRLDSDEIWYPPLSGGSSGKSPYVNEGGFYKALLKRETAFVKDPEKREHITKFQRWVTHEVLPAIRQDGGYMVARPDESDEDIMARALVIANQTLERQNKQIEEMRPKAVFADAVSVSKSTILVGDLAKILRQNGFEVGANRLFGILREQGYLCKQKGAMWNMPTQRSMELGLFVVKETTIIHSDGHSSINKTPKVTGKGQIYFINRFCKAAKGNG